MLGIDEFEELDRRIGTRHFTEDFAATLRESVQGHRASPHPRVRDADAVYGFDFPDNTVSGTLFEVTIAKTSLLNGYAFYRMFLYDEHNQRIEGAVVPEPQGYAMVLGGLGLAWALVRRKRNTTVPSARWATEP